MASQGNSSRTQHCVFFPFCALRILHCEKRGKHIRPVLPFRTWKRRWCVEYVCFRHSLHWTKPHVSSFLGIASSLLVSRFGLEHGRAWVPKRYVQGKLTVFDVNTIIAFKEATSAWRMGLLTSMHILGTCQVHNFLGCRCDRYPYIIWEDIKGWM